MLLKKFTTGYVTQVFDTDKREFISQDFTAANGEVDYEDEDGNAIGCDSFLDKGGDEVYLPFEMKQPYGATDESEMDLPANNQEELVNNLIGVAWPVLDANGGDKGAVRDAFDNAVDSWEPAPQE
jgi:hypothetical protein